MHRIELRRLLNKTSNSLTSSERSEFLAQLPCMELELLLKSLCQHPQLCDGELVMSTLRERVDAMSLRQLGISLTLYPQLLEFDAVLQAFHVSLNRAVQAGWDAHGLASLFAENLGPDTYRALVERAVPAHAEAADAHRAFRRVLSMFPWRQPVAAGNDAPSAPDADAADRAAETREAERSRRAAELGQRVAALRARCYLELPTPDEVARLDAASRAAWNESVRSELDRCDRKVDGAACYYLRYPSRDALFDAETIARLERHVSRDRLDRIIDTEDLRSFIPRTLVAEQIIERHDEPIWVERAPEWLDDALIERARRVRREDELWALVARFSDPTRADKRRGLLAVLVERVVTDAARDIHGIYAIAGELLSGNKTLWKDRGQALVLAALRRGGLLELTQLIHGRPGRFERLDDIEAALKPQVLAMHFAFGNALLSWARELAEAGDAKGVERALGALGVLDPPRYFTNAVHWFIASVPLSDDARLLAEHIHRIAASKGGSDAQVYALVQCIDELRGSSDVQEASTEGPRRPAAAGP